MTDKTKPFNCHPCKNPKCSRMAGKNDYCDACMFMLDRCNKHGEFLEDKHLPEEKGCEDCVRFNIRHMAVVCAVCTDFDKWKPQEECTYRHPPGEKCPNCGYDDRNGLIEIPNEFDGEN